MTKQSKDSTAERPLDILEATILARQAAPDEKSYTAKLLAGGVEKIGGKIIEEAAELIDAAGETDDEGRNHTVHEAADLLYHTLVLLAARDVRLAEVEAELARRFGVSGLEEKAARKQG
ncbi:MAG: phosphoribosyl-ATP diphosphatase [Bythopirellula sp.]